MSNKEPKWTEAELNDNMRSPGKREIRWALIIFLLVTTAYLFGKGAGHSWDCLPNSLLPISVLRYGTLDFNHFPEQVAGSSASGLKYSFLRTQGRIVSGYPILPGVLHIPTVLIASWIGVDALQNPYRLARITAALVAAISVCLLFLLSHHILNSIRASLVLSLAFAFGTTNWSVNAMELWQHGPVVMLLLLSILSLLDRVSSNDTFNPRDNDKTTYKFNPRKLLSGLFLGLAVICRPSVAVLIFPLAVGVLFHLKLIRERVLFGIFISLPIIANEAYAHFYLGSVFTLGQGQSLQGFGGNPFHGALGQLFSPNRGLFFLSPFLLFAIPEGWRLLRKKPPALWFEKHCGIGVASYLALLSFWGKWWGGHCFGYRILTDLLPFLFLFLICGWKDLNTSSRLRRRLFASAVAVSIGFHFLGVWVYPSDFNSIEGGIDNSPARNWDLSEGEIARCLRKLFHIKHT